MSPTWDSAWRAKLVGNLEILTRQLWQVGVTEVFADGSFAEDKDHPNDVDGYFVCGLGPLRSGQLTRELNLLDPYKVWTWDPASRKPYRGYPKNAASDVAQVPGRALSACPWPWPRQRYPGQTR